MFVLFLISFIIFLHRQVSGRIMMNIIEDTYLLSWFLKLFACWIVWCMDLFSCCLGCFFFLCFVILIPLCVPFLFHLVALFFCFPLSLLFCLLFSSFSVVCALKFSFPPFSFPFFVCSHHPSSSICIHVYHCLGVCSTHSRVECFNNPQVAKYL